MLLDNRTDKNANHKYIIIIQVQRKVAKYRLPFCFWVKNKKNDLKNKLFINVILISNIFLDDTVTVLYFNK